MFEMVDFTILEIVLVYIVVGSAGLLTFPLALLIFTAIERGTKRWR
ncbi:hypothetical protein [Amphibacillus jilinensis]|nr:hypothetical protein [Amphibacillus jilinensis]